MFTSNRRRWLDGTKLITPISPSDDNWFSLRSGVGILEVHFAGLLIGSIQMYLQSY